LKCNKRVIIIILIIIILVRGGIAHDIKNIKNIAHNDGR